MPDWMQHHAIDVTWFTLGTPETLHSVPLAQVESRICDKEAFKSYGQAGSVGIHEARLYARANDKRIVELNGSLEDGERQA